jgi:hypothetical protein
VRSLGASLPSPNSRPARFTAAAGLVVLCSLISTCSDPTGPPGTATKLTFVVQPTGATAGATVTPAVQVEAQDAHGHTATSFTGAVNLVFQTNPTGATLSGTTTVTALGGVATFPALSIDKSGTGYRLAAVSLGLADATSDMFAITAGAPVQLAFVLEPRSTVAGAAIAPAVKVAAQDALGNTVPAFTGNIVLGITTGTGTGGATLSGTTALNAVAGVATFSTLSIDLIGTKATGSAYTLSATATGLATATSTTFDITAGSASQLLFTVQPSPITVAGLHIAPPVQVTVRDASGNTVAGFTGNVTASIGANPKGGTLSGTTTVAAVNGVATFSTLSIDSAAGGYTLLAKAPGLTSGASSAFVIAPGPATRLDFTLAPSTTTVRAPITPGVQVTARDAQGNMATGFNGNVTVAIVTNPGSGTLSGIQTVAAIAGIATFPGLSIDQVGTGYQLSATAPGLASDTSAGFDIIASTPTHLAFTIHPATTAAGATITPAVEVIAQDLSNQTATAFAGAVTLAVSGGNGVALLGTTTVTAVNGVATFPDLHVDKSGAAYELTATASGLTAATSGRFDITAGPATQLMFAVHPSAATTQATITPQVEVIARDALGNTADGFTSNVTVAIGNNPGGGTLSGTTTLAAVAGVASFADLSINQAGVGYTLTASGGGLPPATSGAFDILAGAVTHLVFTVQPPSTTAAGTQLTPAVQVTATDAGGNPVTGFSSNVTLSITGGTGTSGATLSGTTTVAAVAGVATFSTLSIDKNGTGYKLSATATGVSGATSTAFAITAGAATRLVFTGQPPLSATAGSSLTPAVGVSALDAQGNTSNSFTGTISVAIAANPGGGTLSGTKAVAAVGGVASFAGLSIDRSGTGYTLSATATGVTGATSRAFTITPGPATKLAFSLQPSTTTAGTAITPAVELTARDANGNPVPTFAGNVTVAIATNPGGGILSGTKTVPAASGVARFSDLSIDKSGTGYTLTATGGGLSGATSASFNIVAGLATQLVFTVSPTQTTAGATIRPAVRVAALDAFGNTARGFAGNVTAGLGANPGNGTLSGTRTFAAVAGVATFPSLNIDSVGIGYTLTAAAPGLTAATSPVFDIISSTPSRLFFTEEPTDTVNSVSAGAVISPPVQVTVRDVSGQMVTSFTGNVTLTIAAGTGTSGATLLGTTTVAAVGGVASFSDLKINQAGAGYKLAAATGGLPSVTSSFFDVAPGPATQLVFTGHPSTATAKATITPQVEVSARDALGNAVDGFTGTIALAIGTNPGGGTLSGTTTAAPRPPAAAAVFSDLSIDKSGSGYTLTATTPGLTGATSAPFDISVSRATELVFTVQPTSRIAGATIAPAVQVTARNAAGLTATNFTGDVTVQIAAGSGTSDATLSGTKTVTAVAGVATFSTLSIDRSGSGYRLSATATGLAGAESNAFTINPGAPSQLAITGQPDMTMAGATVTPVVEVTVRDALGNPVKSFTGDVTVAFAAGANPGNGTLSGTTTVATVGGVASFNDLSIDRAGVGYRLEATAAGVSSVITNAFTITPGPATLLIFSVQPSSATAGALIKPNVRVAAFDALGNAATGFTGNVTVAITPNTGTSGAILSGTTTLSAINGVAQFSDLKIDRAGSGYRLTATASGVTGVTSTTFDIN